MKKKYLAVDFGLFNLFRNKFEKKNLQNIFNEILEELRIEVILITTI